MKTHFKQAERIPKTQFKMKDLDMNKHFQYTKVI